MGKKIRTAVVGVGNCCSAFTQAVHYYALAGNSLEGIPNPDIRGYKLGDIELVAAFDIDKRKVGRDLSEAIFAAPNNYDKVCEVPYAGVRVVKGPVLDGATGMLAGAILLSDEPEADVVSVLKESRTEVLVNLLPAGAEEASRFYAEASLKAGCGFINATPTAIACDPRYARRFEEAGLPLVGDDLMSQIGGTVLHKKLLEFLVERGVKVMHTYQLDVGGSLETYNTLEPSRRALKRAVKTDAIESILPYNAEIVAGTTDYVDFLKNSRVSYYWIEGRYFLGAPFEIDIYLRTADAPNCCSVLFDSIRGVKVALERRIGGPLISLCAYGYKRAPVKGKTDEALRWFREFIEGKRER
ncbi:MAG: inositol-3-phosphate synthase [Candidatus Bathyarchaeia archaeon]